MFSAVFAIILQKRKENRLYGGFDFPCTFASNIQRSIDYRRSLTKV